MLFKVNRKKSLQQTASHRFNGKIFFVLKKGFFRKSIGNPFFEYTKLALKTALKGNQSETIPFITLCVAYTPLNKQ